MSHKPVPSSDDLTVETLVEMLANYDWVNGVDFDKLYPWWDAQYASICAEGFPGQSADLRLFGLLARQVTNIGADASLPLAPDVMDEGEGE